MTLHLLQILLTDGLTFILYSKKDARLKLLSLIPVIVKHLLQPLQKPLKNWENLILLPNSYQRLNPLVNNIRFALRIHRAIKVVFRVVIAHRCC